VCPVIILLEGHGRVRRSHELDHELVSGCSYFSCEANQPELPFSTPELANSSSLWTAQLRVRSCIFPFQEGMVAVHRLPGPLRPPSVPSLRTHLRWQMRCSGDEAYIASNGLLRTQGVNPLVSKVADRCVSGLSGWFGHVAGGVALVAGTGV
jgi:hypothetical protein